MTLDGGIHIRDRQLRELRLQVRSVILNAVVPAVERVAEPGALRLCEDIGVLGQKFASRLEGFLRKTVPNQPVILVQSRAQGEHAVVCFDRTDPDLENLLLPCKVWIGGELKHSAWEILDVGIIAVIQATRLPQALIKASVG